MGPLAIIVALELVITSGIIGFSSHPQALKQAKHKISNVLGIQKIAQVEDNSGSSTPDTSQPANNPPPDQAQPTDQSSTSAPAQPEQSQAPVSSSPPSSESSPTPTSSDQNLPSTPDQSQSSDQTNSGPTSGQPSPSEMPNLFEQELNPSPTPEGQESSSPNPQSSGEPSPSPASVETGASQTQAVLSPDDLINSPENIDNKSVEEVKKEDTQLDQTTDPAQQTKLLVDFATDKIKDMNNFSKSDDFTSTNFAAQRFNEQMDKAISNLEKVPVKDQAKLKKQLVNFCDQADKVLRTVELSVPEEGEQDLEIARGQCQELNL